MKKIISAKLIEVRRQPGPCLTGFWFSGGSGKEYVGICSRTLRSYVHLPISVTNVWIELSSKQWMDKSGIQIVLKISECSTFPNCWIGEHEEYLAYSAREYLLTNFLESGVKTTAYFRVWYV